MVTTLWEILKLDLINGGCGISEIKQRNLEKTVKNNCEFFTFITKN